MDLKQTADLEQRQQRLSMSDAELLRCAREIAHNGRMQSFGELSWFEARELIGFLDLIERDRKMLKMRQELVTA